MVVRRIIALVVPVAALQLTNAAIASPTATPAAEHGELIRSVAVVGAQRLEPASIAGHVQLRPGQVYTAAAGEQPLRDLAATELFAGFSIANDNGNVVITVVENPVVNRIVLSGKSRLREEEILSEIRMVPGEIFDRSKLRFDRTRVAMLYERRGAFDPVVEPRVVPVGQNRVDVVFEINEGQRIRVREINIIGNEAFSDSQLRGEMLHQVGGFFEGISGRGTSHDPNALTVDAQNLRAFYLRNGYSDFRVTSSTAELTPDRRELIVTYVVEEGERLQVR